MHIRKYAENGLVSLSSILGVVVSLFSPSTIEGKVVWVSTFSVLGVLSVWIKVRSEERSDSMVNQLTKTLEQHGEKLTRVDGSLGRQHSDAIRASLTNALEQAKKLRMK